MVIIGFSTAVVMGRFDIDHYNLADAAAMRADFLAFLAIPFNDMLVFGPLVLLAILWRKKPELHRRLLFIATCCLMDAAFGRFEVFDRFDCYYICLDVYIFFGVFRDLIVDKRVHKVYLYTLPIIIFGQSLATYLRFGNPPWWQSFTHWILF
jgi:hypothetical protein